jgi:hypothetical protein
MTRIRIVVLLLFLQIQAEARGSGNLLSDWISVHLRLIRTTSDVAHVAYSRHFAYTSIAFYESGIHSNGKYRSIANQLQGLGNMPASSANTMPEVAANAAYAEMLRYFYKDNSNVSIIDSTERANNNAFTKSRISKNEITSSVYFGREVAKTICKWSATDGSAQSTAEYSPPVGDGLWQPTPPGFAKANLPYWRNNRTLVAGSTTNVIVSRPPPFSVDVNSQFYTMVNEVYNVARNLTEEQKNIAWFWDDSPGKYMTVFGHWSSILARVIVDQELSLEKSAEAYAKMCMSLHDAGIAAWEGKYKFNLIRPVTYIQKYIDANWLPIIGTPPHMEFPAAHATLSNAAASALADALGDKVAFTDNTYEYLGMSPRKFASFQDAAREAGVSRLYGGIHYMSSIEEGLAIGKRTADNVLRGITFMKSQDR